jgi:hypothetical protein
VCVWVLGLDFYAVYDGYDGFMMMSFDARCVDMNGILRFLGCFVLPSVYAHVML